MKGLKGVVSLLMVYFKINMKVSVFIMDIFNQFWVPRGIYKSCGMFTDEHMILLLISVCVLTFLLIISIKITVEKIDILTKVFAVTLTFLEGIKIFFNFYWGYTKVNYWFPISFCSIFIYALWMSGFTRGYLKKIGDSFITAVTVVAGGAYLLVPSTSLTAYPMGHYLCIYSMLFHTLMIYMGVLYLRKKQINLNWRTFKKFGVIYLFFTLISIFINNISGSNLMMLSSPANIPLRFLHTLYGINEWAYTGFVFIVYLFVPYWGTSYTLKIIKKSNNKKNREEFNGDNLEL